MKNKQKNHVELKTRPQMATQVDKLQKGENGEVISEQIMLLPHRKALVRCSSRTKALCNPADQRSRLPHAGNLVG